MMTKNAADKFIVEVFRHGSYIKRRVFTLRAKAIDFVNDFQDEHCDEGYQLQMVHNGQIEQFGINGNNR